MLMRKLGRTGLKVSALCLGGNTFGWTTDQKASEAVLDAYVEAGGNFIDTADVYSRWAPGNKGGESETALGIWMTGAQEPRAPCSSPPRSAGRWGRARTTPASRASTSWRASRPRSGGCRPTTSTSTRPTGTISETPLEETLRAFDDLVRQGKVRYIGASNYQAWRLTRALWESDKRGYARYESLAAQVQPGLPRRVRARARAALPRAGRGRDPLLLARQRLPLGQVPPGRAAAQDRARRRRAEELHERPRLRRARGGREGRGGRQRHARAGRALLARAPPRHHRADRQRHHRRRSSRSWSGGIELQLDAEATAALDQASAWRES